MTNINNINDHQYRTHNCSQLNKTNLGQQVKLSGWVHRLRDHGDLLFIDLRDHYGITQLVIEIGANYFEQAEKLKNETVITVTGEVVARADDAVNSNLPTGEIEITISSLHIESIAEPLPLQVNSDREFPEETRLKYRYLDLRREFMHNNIILRSKIISRIRQLMTEQSFMEIQTPILTASSPEGARDYLVPSRVHAGKFYALPQAPQQFKQLLMVSGFDKYFQIAPCFRDEDARADRSPGEFYQLDMEMAFATQEDVFAAIEPLMVTIFNEFSDWQVTDAPFPRISYKDAMLKYGSDKPDLRNPIEICDVSEVFAGSDFKIFAKNVAAGKTVRAIPVKSVAEQPRSFFDKVNNFAQEQGAPGMGYILLEEKDGKLSGKGPIAKFLDEQRTIMLAEKCGIKAGDAVFFASDDAPKAAHLAGLARTHIAEQLDLIEEGVYKFCWIVDFPFFEYNEDSKSIEFSHNPFSMPQGGLDALEKQDPLEILAWQYDIVCNGVELSSGAIRNHRPDIMLKAFEIAGYNKEVVEDRFGALFEAFHYGAPPHGGIAPGVDRMIMLLANEPNIREVIAFPMNQRAEDLLMNAPAIADDKHLQELNIQLSAKARQILAEAEEEQADARENHQEEK